MTNLQLFYGNKNATNIDNLPSKRLMKNVKTFYAEY